jgi:hypothetical protein
MSAPGRHQHGTPGTDRQQRPNLPLRRRVVEQDEELLFVGVATPERGELIRIARQVLPRNAERDQEACQHFRWLDGRAVRPP